MSNRLSFKSAALPQGSMPPLHTRDTDEGYVVLDGEVSFYIGNDIVQAKAGDAVVVPSGVPRSFRVRSATARWRVLTAARSLSRYEDFTRAVTQPTGASATSWPSAEEAASLQSIAAANGIDVLGPPGMLPAQLAAQVTRLSAAA